jgi:hypothetical protein
MSVIQHNFICRPSDSTVSEDAVIEPRTVATLAKTTRRSNHSDRSHQQDKIALRVGYSGCDCVSGRLSDIINPALWLHFLALANVNPLLVQNKY